MYAVVGCSDCSALWVLSDPRSQDRATCSRCGRRHRVSNLRHLFEAEEAETARQARARILARRQGEGEAFDDVPSGADLERAADEAGVDEEAYLARSGLDPDAVAAAGERAGEGSGSTGSGDRASVVRAAVREQAEPTADEVVAYATERGVPAEAARDLLGRLRKRGVVTRQAGRYRLL